MGNIIRDIWSPLERRPPILEQVTSCLPSCLDPRGNFEQFSPAAPKKEVLAGMLIGAGRGGWALSIELGRYCLVKGGLTMEPYLGPLLTPSNPRSFVKAAIGEVPHHPWTSQSGVPTLANQ